MQGVLSTAAAQHDARAQSLPATPSHQSTPEGLMEMVLFTPSHELDKALEDLDAAVLRLQEDHSDWAMEKEAVREAPTSPNLQSNFTDSGRFDSPGKPMIQLVSG